MALSKIEKQIKRINSRIVQQVKKYGLNAQIMQTYLEPLQGQSFVKYQARKIGEDAQNQPVYQVVPQLITSNKYSTSQQRFISKFEQQKTPSGRIIQTLHELKKDDPTETYTREDVEQLLNEYDEVKTSMEDILYKYYELYSKPEIESDADIIFLRQDTSEASKLEILEAYKSLVNKVEAREGLDASLSNYKLSKF